MLKRENVEKGMKLKMKSKEECEEINTQLTKNAGLTSTMPYGKVVTVKRKYTTSPYIEIEDCGWSYNTEWFDIYEPKETNKEVLYD